MDDPDAFEKQLNDIVNQIYSAHRRLQEEIFPMLGLETTR